MPQLSAYTALTFGLLGKAITYSRQYRNSRIRARIVPQTRRPPRYRNGYLSYQEGCEIMSQTDFCGTSYLISWTMNDKRSVTTDIALGIYPDGTHKYCIAKIRFNVYNRGYRPDGPALMDWECVIPVIGVWEDHTMRTTSPNRFSDLTNHRMIMDPRRRHIAYINYNTRSLYIDCCMKQNIRLGDRITFRFRGVLFRPDGPAEILVSTPRND